MQSAAAPSRQWGSGKVIKVERAGTSYDYSIFNGNCGYVGRSAKKLNVDLNADVQFTVEGRSLLIVDGRGKVQRTQYRLQWLAPPPPPPTGHAPYAKMSINLFRISSAV